jgi:hypothetical protein
MLLQNLTLEQIDAEIAEVERVYRLRLTKLRAVRRVLVAEREAAEADKPKLPAGATNEIPAVHGSNR